MKRFLFALAALVIGASGAMAQTTTEFSAKAGIGISNYMGDSKADPQFAYRVGLGVDITGTGIWGFQTGLNFEGLGARSSEDYMGLSASVHQLYLEVPLMATAGIRATDNLKVIFNAGPYLAVGVGGKSSVSTEDYDGKITLSSNTFGEDGLDLRRFDFGIGLGSTLEIKEHFLVGLDFRIGCLKLDKNYDPDFEDSTARNFAGFLTFGYKF